ncbi:hypothetical protein BASA81_005125 [Batrachochytrium salamandrivorans]|nr:hypothetical protein BASA81_005125 [Batrachochytrium salamandrivorans]
MGELDCSGAGGGRKKAGGVGLLKDAPVPSQQDQAGKRPLPRSPSPEYTSNPQELPSTPSNRRSSIELLDCLSDSAFKTKSLRSANLDDAYAKDLITDEEYASRIKELNISGLTNKDSEHGDLSPCNTSFQSRMMEMEATSPV